MLRDLRNTDARDELRGDVCIIGAGAAGITLARSLTPGPLRVLLLESGGFEPEPAIQGLYDGVSEGLLPDAILSTCRLRYFGGTTNHWANWCAPLDPIDFEERPWLRWSGWPLQRGELDPFYASAQRLCGLADLPYAPTTWTRAFDDFPAFDPTKLATRLWQIGEPPVRFGPRYRTELERSANVEVVLHANVTHLETDSAGSRVAGAVVRNLDGFTKTVTARSYVLACGAIENARLLLLSDRNDPRGIGNRHDLVGRFFTQHPHVTSAAIQAEDPIRLAAWFRRQDRAGIGLRPCLCPTPEAQAREKIASCSLSIEYEVDPESGYVATRELGRTLLEGEWPDAFSEKLLAALADLDGSADAVRDASKDVYEPPLRGVTVYSRAEQAPNAASRITLSDTHDALGLPRARMEWRLTEQDRRTIAAANRLLGEEITRLGIGRLRIDDWLLEADAPWPGSLGTGCHHMGSTRMASDPARGVVDADCRAHDVDNLYLAGASVFPTSGWANPTLTVVALALRLADHLRGAP